MPTPNPGIETLLKSLQFGGPDAPPSGARLPAAAPAPAMTAPGRRAAAPPAASPPAGPAPPDLAGALMAILGQLGAAPPAPPARLPAPASPRAVQQPVLSAETHSLIAAALGDPASDAKPLWVSADDLDELGIDAAALPALLDPMGLHVLPFGGEGGMLMARSPGVLEAAERARDDGKPVLIIPVRSRQAEAPGSAPGRGRRTPTCD